MRLTDAGDEYSTGPPAQGHTETCPTCKTLNPTGTRICAVCTREAFPSKAAVENLKMNSKKQYRTCNACKTSVLSTRKWCLSCGHTFSFRYNVTGRGGRAHRPFSTTHAAVGAAVTAPPHAQVPALSLDFLLAAAAAATPTPPLLSAADTHAGIDGATASTLGSNTPRSDINTGMPARSASHGAAAADTTETPALATQTSSPSAPASVPVAVPAVTPNEGAPAVPPAVPPSAASALAPEGPRFIAAVTFKGSKLGYIFKTGDVGLGYYRDVGAYGPKTGYHDLMWHKNGAGNQQRPHSAAAADATALAKVAVEAAAAAEATATAIATATPASTPAATPAATVTAQVEAEADADADDAANAVMESEQPTPEHSAQTPDSTTQASSAVKRWLHPDPNQNAKEYAARFNLKLEGPYSTLVRVKRTSFTLAKEGTPEAMLMFSSVTYAAKHTNTTEFRLTQARPPSPASSTPFKRMCLGGA